MAINLSRAPLRGLATFRAAAAHESFRAASEELFVTASAVSHQIKTLESALGVTLFDRSGRALTLTEAGRSLYEETSPLLQQLHDVVLRHTSKQERRVLRVSVQPFFASELFVPNLNTFIRRHPDIDIRVDTSDESSERIPADADVSIRLFRTPPPGKRADLLFPLQLEPVGSAEFASGIVVRNRQIVSDFPIVVHESRPDAWTKWASASAIRLPRLSKKIRLDSMIAVARAAERGIGAALVPARLSSDWFSSGNLVPLFDDALFVDGGYYLICREGWEKDEGIRVFRNWVLHTFNHLLTTSAA